MLISFRQSILGWLYSSIRWRKRAFVDVTASQKMAVLQCCVGLLVEIPSSRVEFDLNNRKSREVLSISKELGNVPCVVAYFNSKISSVWCHHLINNMHPTRHTSGFFEIDKTAGAYSLQIYDNSSQMQSETNCQTQRWRTASVRLLRSLW